MQVTVIERQTDPYIANRYLDERIMEVARAYNVHVDEIYVHPTHSVVRLRNGDIHIVDGNINMVALIDLMREWG